MKSLLYYFSALDKYIDKVERFILCLAIILMAVNTIANVLGRFVFNQSIFFSEELNEILIVIVAFMGLGYATRKGIHIRMSAIYETLSNRYRKLLMIIITSVTAVVLAMLAWYSFEYVQKVASRGRVTPALQFPLYLTYVWVVLGFLLASIQYFLATIKNLDFSDDEVYVSYVSVDTMEDPETAAAIATADKITDTESSDSNEQKG